jgi:hypothetical protein
LSRSASPTAAATPSGGGDVEHKHSPDDPRPDVFLDDIIAEHDVESDKIEAEHRRLDLDRRVVAVADLLEGLNRNGIHDVLERAGRIARQGMK